MNTYEEIAKLLREITEELKHDNDAHDNRKEKEIQTSTTTEEQEND